MNRDRDKMNDIFCAIKSMEKEELDRIESAVTSRKRYLEKGRYQEMIRDLIQIIGQLEDAGVAIDGSTLHRFSLDTGVELEYQEEGFWSVLLYGGGLDADEVKEELNER